MSTTVDNLTLALLSLKETLETYLNDNGWKRQYRIFIGGDPILRSKELVENATDTRNQIELPVIILDAPLASSETRELGNVSGTDIFELTLVMLAVDSNQLRTLANMLRRKVDNLVFDIRDYTTGLHKDVGDGVLLEATLADLSNWSAERISERYNGIINVTLEMDSASVI